MKKAREIFGFKFVDEKLEKRLSLYCRHLKSMFNNDSFGTPLLVRRRRPAKGDVGASTPNDTNDDSGLRQTTGASAARLCTRA
jgi:hypothetical protein